MMLILISKEINCLLQKTGLGCIGLTLGAGQWSSLTEPSILLLFLLLLPLSDRVTVENKNKVLPTKVSQQNKTSQV